MAAQDNKKELIESTLNRLTQGIPKRELKLVISEAEVIEKDLLKDIQILEAALAGKEEDTAATDKILDSLLTPMDQSWTAPALLGRLRGELAIPTLLSAKGQPSTPQTEIVVGNDNPKALLDITKHPMYTREHETPADILGCWKKIFSSKGECLLNFFLFVLTVSLTSTVIAAFVFKKPVKPEEAPGYTDRIKFPMDLSMVRKMIVSRKIKSFQQLHRNIGLISHNCVKYNGRDTDYGLVARTFECMADEMIRQAVLSKATSAASSPATVASAATLPAKSSSGAATKS